MCILLVPGDVPDGVDPSFLAALPENIRQEVIADQLRMQRIQACAQVQAADGSGALEVNPEFLAALPANIQEEVCTPYTHPKCIIQFTFLYVLAA